MINWQTILSSFDDKPTLMQWLKMVEKALQNAENGASLYKHALYISISSDGTTSNISVNGYFNYDKEFTFDTLKQYLTGKGRLFIYNNVGSTGVVYNGIAYNNNTQNLEIIGYSLSSNNAIKATITDVNMDNPIKL